MNNDLILQRFIAPQLFFSGNGLYFNGFKVIKTELHAVVKQDFVIATEQTDLKGVKEFLDYNGFKLK